MVLKEDQVTSLAPIELGFTIPFESSLEITEPGGALEWYVSYLYAELWSPIENGPTLLAVALPEFTTDKLKPTSLRFPLTDRAIAMIEALRKGGDVRLSVHLQATLVGTAHMDLIQDPGKRRALELLGLDHEVVGPIRRSQDLEFGISRATWETAILPQWESARFMAATVPGVDDSQLDIQALARTLASASSDGNLEQIMEQVRDPIVGL
jgi:hypothetical protein